jgi:hypothetical protein
MILLFLSTLTGPVLVWALMSFWKTTAEMNAIIRNGRAHALRLSSTSKKPPRWSLRRLNTRFDVGAHACLRKANGFRTQCD